MGYEIRHCPSAHPNERYRFIHATMFEYARTLYCDGSTIVSTPNPDPDARPMLHCALVNARGFIVFTTRCISSWSMRDASRFVWSVSSALNSTSRMFLSLVVGSSHVNRSLFGLAERILPDDELYMKCVYYDVGSTKYFEIIYTLGEGCRLF